MKTLQRLAKLALETFGTKGQWDWMNEFPIQITSAIIQQQWAMKIENIICINDNLQRIAALESLKNSLNDHLQNLQAQLRTSANQFARQAIENLIKVINYQRDMTNELIENKTEDP